MSICLSNEFLFGTLLQMTKIHKHFLGSARAVWWPWPGQACCRAVHKTKVYIPNSKEATTSNGDGLPTLHGSRLPMLANDLLNNRHLGGKDKRIEGVFDADERVIQKVDQFMPVNWDNTQSSQTPLVSSGTEKQGEVAKKKRGSAFYWLNDCAINSVVVDFLKNRRESATSSLEEDQGTICVFNPGKESDLPGMLLDAGVGSLVLLEADKQCSRMWKKFAEDELEKGAGNKVQNISAFHFDFCRLLPNLLKPKGVDCLNRFFEASQCKMSWPDKYLAEGVSRQAPLTFVGVLSPNRERNLILSQFHMLLEKGFLFAWGAVEFLLFVSPFEYARLSNMVHGKAATISSKQLRAVFDVSLVHTEPLSSFVPPINFVKKPHRRQLLKNGLPLDHMYLVHMRPKTSLKFEGEAIEGENYRLFFFFHGQLSRHRRNASVKEKLLAFFPSCDQMVDLLGFDKTKVGELKPHDFTKIYSEIVLPHYNMVKREGYVAQQEDAFIDEFNRLNELQFSQKASEKVVDSFLPVCV